MIPGIEVNTERGHVIAFGLKEFVYGMHRLGELVTLVEAAGGAMIAAHPYRRQLPFELEKDGDWGEALDLASANEAYKHVHAIETLNGRGSERQNAFSAAVCERHDLPQAAGSDAHTRTDVGACATEFEATIADLGDLIAALKSGWFKPMKLR